MGSQTWFDKKEKKSVQSSFFQLWLVESHRNIADVGPDYLVFLTIDLIPLCIQPTLINSVGETPKCIEQPN